MNNLIIIGNGFDLAHNLNTSYASFIRDLFDKKRRDQDLFSDLIGGRIDDSTDAILRDPTHYLRHTPTFFINLIKEINAKNWCDIEKNYFQSLNQVKSHDSLIEINEVLNRIKKYLQSYLIEEEKKGIVLKSYKKYFQLIDSENTTILNFNYTNTLKKYEIKKSKIINIHGELKSESNPIIFGFAANESEISQLLDKDNPDYLLNIKKYNYNQTNNFSDLVAYMDNEDIHIHLFGHSIGLSDKLILSEVFQNKNVTSIRPYYFENFNSYFKIQTGIDRVNGNMNLFKQIITFPNCNRMPQHNDSQNQQREFIEYAENIIQILNQEFENKKMFFG